MPFSMCSLQLEFLFFVLFFLRGVGGTSLKGPGGFQFGGHKKWVNFEIRKRTS